MTPDQNGSVPPSTPPGSASAAAEQPWLRLASAAGLLDASGGLRSTVFEEMSALATQHDAVNLGQGFPDTDGPGVLAEALGRAVAEGRNQYATIAGDPALREEIAAHEELGGRRRPDPETEVTVTAGATEALTASMLAYLSPGDEVVLFEPFYDLYPAVAALAGATVRTVALRPPHFVPELSEIRAAFGPRTRMVVLNDPHNPTGTLFPREALEEVVAQAVEHDALILTDSVYEHLWFDAEPLDVASLPGAAERTIRVSSASKSYSVTGWRVGWAIAPEPLTRGLRPTKGYLSHSAAAPLQRAVAETMAWAREEDYASRLRAAYRKQRGLLLSGLSGTCLEVLEPQGTFFALARLGDDAPEWGRDGTAIAENLPERAGVAVIPLSAFCVPEHRDLYRDWVRFAFCKRPEVLEQAAEQLHRAL